MKVEMGESLFYSWLRHVKACQVVQTNWKPSPSWELHNESQLTAFMKTSGELFAEKYSFNIYRGASFRQVLAQAEADAVGVKVADDEISVCAIDVAFHEAGLNYGEKKKTVEKVVQKLLRTAMCVSGYFGTNDGDIIFASPKIHKAITAALAPCVADVNGLFSEMGFGFKAEVIANGEFDTQVLKPILTASAGVADTSELFMRAYQLVKMFEKNGGMTQE
jgi:hypothetical protein